MHLEFAIDESLVRRLPLPLAQLYRRAYNAKTTLERHLAAFYLWEAAIKLLASVTVVEHAEQGAPDPALAERLQSLARPALGHWWEFARRLVPLLAERGDEPFARVRDLLLRKARDDLARAAGLDAALRDALEGKSGARATVRLGELFDRLVQYRNAEVGHGAAGQRPADFYERLGPALLAAAAEVLDRLDVLAGRRLVHVADVRRLTTGNWLVERYELYERLPCRSGCSGSRNLRRTVVTGNLRLTPAAGISPKQPQRRRTRLGLLRFSIWTGCSRPAKTMSISAAAEPMLTPG
jgi:hypothetical protein